MKAKKKISKRVSAVRAAVVAPTGPYTERTHRDRTKYTRKMRFKSNFEDK